MTEQNRPQKVINYNGRNELNLESGGDDEMKGKRW